VNEEELELWRRQWHSQPAIPIELIRKVERQTVYLKLQRLSLILPVLVGIGTIVLAFMTPTLPWVLLSVGTWVFIIVGLVFQFRNDKDIWAPAAETTAAYVDLSIIRCRKTLNDIRYSFIFSPLLTTFVLVALYQVLADSGALRIARDYAIMAGSFLYAAGIVGIVLWLMRAKRKKVEAELAYLLDLQRKLTD
jgi:hypothetical protein